MKTPAYKVFLILIISFMSCNISTEKTWVDESHRYYLNVEHDGLTVYSATAPTFCQGFKKVGSVFISTTKGVYGDSISIYKAKNKLVLSIIGSKGEKYIDNIDGLTFERIRDTIDYDSIRIQFVRNNILQKNEVIDVNQTIAQMIADPQVTLTEANEHGEVTYQLFQNGEIAYAKSGATVWPCK